jgi:hypothetical protein
MSPVQKGRIRELLRDPVDPSDDVTERNAELLNRAYRGTEPILDCVTFSRRLHFISEFDFGDCSLPQC